MAFSTDCWNLSHNGLFALGWRYTTQRSIVYAGKSISNQIASLSKSICAVLTFGPQLKKILAVSVKDRYQLNYFFCIKDFNTETITSLTLSLFLSLFVAVSIMKGKRYASIYFWYQTDTGVPNISNYSAVSLASPYYNYL